MVRVLVLSILTCVVLPACGGFIETSAAHPLGKFQDVEAFLVTEKGLRKMKSDINNSECFLNMELWESLEGMTVWRYEDDKAGNNTYVKVVVDGSGNIKVVSGRFGSGRMEWTDSGTRVESFIGSLWKAAAGGPATFQKRNRDTSDLEEFLFCQFDKGAVAGRWEKVPQTKRVTTARNLNDYVLFHIK